MESFIRDTRPAHGEIQHAQAAEQERNEADGAQQVLRPLAVADEKLHRQQIEQSLAEARDAVLRSAVLPRPMLHDDLADAKALGGGQHGHEAVQLAVEPDFVHHLAAKRLQAAVVVVQMDARQHDSPAN